MVYITTAGRTRKALGDTKDRERLSIASLGWLGAQLVSIISNDATIIEEAIREGGLWK